MGRLLRRLVFLGMIAGVVVALKRKMSGGPGDAGGDV